MNDIATIERALKDADLLIGWLIGGGPPLQAAIDRNKEQITNALMLLRQIPGQHSPTTAARQGFQALDNAWDLGSMNDGLTIIDKPPRPSTDDMWHDRPDGPNAIVDVSLLPMEKAQEIVDAHNATIAAAFAAGAEAMREACAQHTRTWRRGGLGESTWEEAIRDLPLPRRPA